MSFNTPLHDAAFTNCIEIAELLISHGANLNIKSENGATALDKALRFNHSNFAEFLRTNGADVHNKKV